MELLLAELLYILFVIQRKTIDLQNRNAINKISETPQFENKNYTIPENNFKTYLANFVKILQDNFEPEDLSFLFNNISSLELKVLKNDLIYKILDPNKAAYYDESKNRIIFRKEKYIENSIYHELFHMASTINIKGNKHCGFSQKIEKTLNSFGVGFNEGYTDLLANRYFDKTITYHIETEIAEQIENIVGRKVMERLYLKSDLKSLISELSKYTSLEEINDFMNNVDMICLNKHVNKNQTLMNLTANKILGFLYNIFINRFKENLKMEEKYNNKPAKQLIELQLEYLGILFEKYGIKCWDSNEIKNLNQEKIKKLNNVKLVSFY